MKTVDSTFVKKILKIGDQINSLEIIISVYF